MRALFLTGASGLIGRSLLARLAGSKRAGGKDGLPVVALSRNVGAAPEPNATFVRGDLLSPASYERELAGADTVVHLAALTGKASAAEHFRVNADGTEALVEACRRAGVRRFLFVSSIAATYPDVRAYPYAQSKQKAEKIVRASGLDWAILRPTLVFGKRSPIWRSLASLAKLPLVPVFGSGSVRVQPVFVDDVAEAIATWMEDENLRSAAFDVGGPDVLTFEELLRRMHRALKGGEARVVHLPAKSLIPLLARLEKPLLPLLPLTAGQLHSFVHDSTAQSNELLSRLAPRMTGVERMLEVLSRNG